MKRLLFIINPRSGRSEIKHLAVDCIDAFVKMGYAVTTYVTQGPNDAVRIAQEQAARYDLIVCSGGDGTLNEVITGLMSCDAKPPIGYLPAGTTNDFAATLELPRAPVEAAKFAVSGRPFAIDIGQFNDRYFTYVAAFGAFTSTSYNTPQPAKNLLGRTAYILEGIKSLTNLQNYPIHLTCDGLDIEGDFIYGMVSNATSVGGFQSVPPEEVEIDDGLFEVLLVRPPENLVQLQHIANMLFAQDTSSDQFVSFKTSSVHIHTDVEMPWTLDGEFGGAPHDVQIDNRRKAVSIMVPQRQEKLPV